MCLPLHSRCSGGGGGQSVKHLGVMHKPVAEMSFTTNVFIFTTKTEQTFCALVSFRYRVYFCLLKAHTHFIFTLPHLSPLHSVINY